MGLSLMKLSVIIFFSLMFLSCTKYIDDFSVFDFMNIADTVLIDEKIKCFGLSNDGEFYIKGSEENLGTEFKDVYEIFLRNHIGTARVEKRIYKKYLNSEIKDVRFILFSTRLKEFDVLTFKWKWHACDFGLVYSPDIDLLSLTSKQLEAFGFASVSKKNYEGWYGYGLLGSML